MSKRRSIAQRELDKVLELFRLPPKLHVHEWAAQHRRLAAGTGPKPGPYVPSFAPYQIEPQEAFLDHSVVTTVLMWASRLGKTEIMNNLDGYMIDYDPCSILVVYPTLDSAKKWSKEFFMPMIKATPCLRKKIRDSRAKDANNTILSKEFPGGKISAIGTNSPSGFRQIQARYVKCDEADAMEDGAEGDPIVLAFKRADNYKDSIQIVSSTPTIKGFSRIENYYQQSDQRKWFCPCPKCGQFQVLKWAQVRFSFPDETGKLTIQPERAVYVCEHCSAELGDAEREAMIRAGEWRATAPFNGVRGYWLNGLNTLFAEKKGYKGQLHKFAVEFLDAKSKGPAALKTWTNTFLCETWEEAGSQLQASPIMKRREDYGGPDQNNPILPAGVLVLTCAVDVQQNRLEYEVVGHGPEDESWGILRGVCWGNPQEKEVWTELDNEILTKKFPREDGSILGIAQTFIDAGDGNSQQAVYRFVKPRQVRRVFAIRGSSTPNAPLIATAKFQRAQGIRLLTIGTDTAKATIYGRLEITEPGPRYAHFPNGFGYDQEHFEQLVSEVVKTEMRRGIPIRTWKKIRDRNESLDLRVYNEAAIEDLKPNWKALARNVNRTKEPQEVKEYDLKPVEEKKKVPFVTTPRRMQFGKSGFVNGWK